MPLLARTAGPPPLIGNSSATSTRIRPSFRISTNTRPRPETRKGSPAASPPRRTPCGSAKAFSSRYWYRCVRALGIRVRGIYATKDTFVTAALQANVKVAWLEAQTGVAYATLKRHYGKWITPEGASELERFATLEPTLFGGAPETTLPPRGNVPGAIQAKVPKGERVEMRGGGLEPVGPREKAEEIARLTGRNGRLRAGIAPRGAISEVCGAPLTVCARWPGPAIRAHGPGRRLPGARPDLPRCQPAYRPSKAPLARGGAGGWSTPPIFIF